MEARRHPRYKLEVEVRIYPRNAQVVRGHSVDISESGISAMLREEVPIGEVVRKVARNRRRVSVPFERMSVTSYSLDPTESP